MKTLATKTLRLRQAGFTLGEMAIAAGVFSLLAASVLSAQLFGLRMFHLASPRLTAGYHARAAMNRIRDEVRTSQQLCVGSGNNLSFTPLSSNLTRQGNALQIYPTSSTNTYIRYYLDAGKQQLKRVASGSTNVQVVASYVANQLLFQAQDCAGNSLTNDLNVRVIQMTLDFTQWKLPGATNGVYDYYHLRTTMTRRAQ